MRGSRLGLAMLGTIIASVAPPAMAQNLTPRVNYQLHCMGCHLADGSGEADRIPSLRPTFVKFAMSTAGRNYVLRVPGVAQASLSDPDVAAVLNWIAKNLNDAQLPPGFVEFTADEVRDSRRERPLAAVRSVRAELLKDLR